MINFYFLIVIVNLVIFLNLKKISQVINIFDLPDKRLKIHKKKTPLLGGTIFLINFLVLCVYQLIFLNEFLFLEKSFLKLEILLVSYF